MIKWFEGNPLGMVLAAICGGLLLISLLLGVIWSLPPSVPDADPDSEQAIPALNVPSLGDSEPLEAYAVITERPVFNESRMPVIMDDLADENADELLAEEEVDAPDVELAGVVITPTIRMATLRSKDLPESLVAFEGQPLEGNFGTWHVSRIGPREVTLSSAGGDEVQLKLQIHDVTIAEPPKSGSDESAISDAPAAQAGDSDQPLSRAEEIRQRIAERREELRRAAEEKEPAEEIDYQQAIQSMVSGPKRKQTQDENEN